MPAVGRTSWCLRAVVVPGRRLAAVFHLYPPALARRAGAAVVDRVPSSRDEIHSREASQQGAAREARQSRADHCEMQSGVVAWLPSGVAAVALGRADAHRAVGRLMTNADEVGSGVSARGGTARMLP